MEGARSYVNSKGIVEITSLGTKKFSKSNAVQPQEALSETTPYTIEATKLTVLNTVPLNISVVNQLCRDKDGCEVTLGMRDWKSNEQPGNVASKGPYRLFLSQTSQWWRLSNTDTAGTDANGKVEHILKAWDCFFTDGEYTGGTGTDKSVQLGLLNWNKAYNDPNMVCTLTIRD
jgi:hypothetical protein